jgi:hypothetical protein
MTIPEVYVLIVVITACELPIFIIVARTLNNVAIITPMTAKLLHNCIHVAIARFGTDIGVEAFAPQETFALHPCFF